MQYPHGRLSSEYSLSKEKASLLTVMNVLQQIFVASLKID